MTPDQVAEAQKRTSEWQPKTSSVATESRSAAAAAPPSNETAADLFGTGFFVTRDGEALTNAHVVDGCSQTSARFGNQGFAARVLNRDVQNDLALIKVEVRPDEVAHFRLTAKQGENVAVYGFPLPGLLSSGGNLTGGNVTALTGLSDDSRFLQISAPVQPGNSGGPLFDQSGNVIGIVVGKLDALKMASITNDIPQNVNFAIKAAVAASFLDSNGITYVAGEFADSLSDADISKRARAFTVQIECRK